MRVKYYKKLFGQMSCKKPFVFSLLLVIIIIFLVMYFIKEITPTIKTLCDNRARAIALQVTNETINDFLKTVDYDTLMQLRYNDEGKLIALNANIIEMNKLSSNISYNIQKKLLQVESVSVGVPIGKLLGWSIFSGYGPDIKVKLVPTGNVQAKFKTEFTSQGINQTKHTIYVQIDANVRTIAPFVSDTVSFTNYLAVAETIIIGDIPETYYNIEGLEAVDKTGVLELVP